MKADYEKDRCIQELFSEHAARTPEAVAVVCGDEQLSYQELEERSNQLGHHLRLLGVGAESIVGLCVERSIEMVVVNEADLTRVVADVKEVKENADGGANVHS